MRNPNNKEGMFLGPPKQGLVTKSATGITRVAIGADGGGLKPLTHGDSPLTPATDRSNWGVNPRSPKGGPED